jgi:predicted phage terminase large subunit-like protein
VEGTENRVRWFIVIDNKAQWADSPEECYELHGKPRGMIYAHGMTEEDMLALSGEEKLRLCMPKSFRFIPTGVFDNPYLLPPRNTSYLANLLAQPYVNQLKYLHGSWTAKESGSGYFKRDWTPIVDFPPVNPISRVRSWDLAASEVTVSNPSPDWTAGVKLSRDSLGIYYVEDVARMQSSTDKVLKAIVEVAQNDGLDDCQVTIPKDPGAAGATANSFYIRTLAEHGIAAKSCVISGHTGKITKFKPFAALCESGAVRIVKGAWNEAFLLELEQFEGSRNEKNDQVDAVSDAFATLARQVQLPTFSIPTLEGSSPVPKM